MDGWIILDKNSGIYSRTVGGRVARIFGNKKFGHIGTLDPMASGVLPIAIGNATKMIPFVEELNPNTKEYIFGVRFGVDSNTLDITGNIVTDCGDTPTENDIKSVLPSFIGEQMQIPPMYSAVHIDGVRAYDVARRGGAVDIPPRKIHIYELEYMGKSGESFQFRVLCSRGTYVRAIARDIAKKLGTFAVADMIRRTKSGCFDVKSAVTLDFLENVLNNGGDIGEFLMPTDSGLGDIPVVNLDDKDTEHYVHGGFIYGTWDNGLKRIYNRDKFIGVGYVDGGILRPKRTI
ncbi:MAG: tRNA pseudouridine(55) synthase TruB [Alphaproteobacteria bacterium]|nr:tRNA pseudouridine(55) synthase TruB [Alphaproteobacteria bacterium]